MPSKTPPPADDAAQPADDFIEQVAAPIDGSDIYERLAWAQSQVRNVDKRGRNAEQKYDYAKAEDVYAMVRPILAKAGISYLVGMNGPPTLEPTGQETSRGLAYQRWWIDVTIMLRSPEVPQPPVTTEDADGKPIVVPHGGKANEIKIAWRCVADDYSDKGAAKAMTLGLKSWLMATFMVSSGTDDAEATDRQAGTTQPAGTRGTRGGPGNEEPRPTAAAKLAAQQRQAFAASRTVEGEFGPEKAVEITRYITGASKIKEITDPATLTRLVGAFDAYRTRTDQREANDAKMAEHLRALQDAAAEGPVAQPEDAAPEQEDDDVEQDREATPEEQAQQDALMQQDFDPATEPPPPVVDPPAGPDGQTTLGEPS